MSNQETAARPTEPDVSVVIAAWNCWDDLERCLVSLREAEPASSRYDVIVVDNGSVDGTPEKLTRGFPAVRLVRNHENLGHTRAVNQGIEAARGKFLVLLDADTVVKAGAFSLLCSFFNERPDVAVVAPRMFNGDGSMQETARDFPKPINGVFGRQSVMTRWFPNNRFSRRYLRSDARNQREPFEVEWVSAACMVFPTNLSDRIGPWDEGFHSYWVDADWCKRARQVGKIYCVPEAEVIHFEQNRRGTRKSRARILLFHKSVNRFYRKHYTRGHWDPRAVFASLVLYTRAWLLVLGNQFLPVNVEEKNRAASPTLATDSEH